MFNGIYHDRRVLVTGHTGFKGSWLALWLTTLGADVVGYALPAPTEPNHFDCLGLDLKSIAADIRDEKKLIAVFKEHAPEIVFHLAAQPIVRASFQDPVETFSTNVLGTVHVLQAARACEKVRAVVNITSDKCYENREWPWGYRESDPVGGYDPYSASKGCAEIVTSCWRNSFFNPNLYGKSHRMLIASCRAGNVIGGGDWAVDRLLPDIVRAASHTEKVKLRNPQAMRAWQHVLEPLSGYLLLGQKLLDGQAQFAEAWNFGPSEDGHATVDEIVDQARRWWPKIEAERCRTADQPHEADILRLDCSKALVRLKWRPVWDAMTAVEKTILWYRGFYEGGRVASADDLQSYLADACRRKLVWAEA